MKTWFHNHRLHRQPSDAKLRIQRIDEDLSEKAVPTRPLPVLPSHLESAARIAASKTSSRISIERYLSAPLEDEPAALPDINAALKRQAIQNRAFPLPTGSNGSHSRESSYDVNSDARPTFYTSGSVPDSPGTSYSAVSGTNNHRALKTPPPIPELPVLGPSDADNARISSPERPTTSGTIGTVDMEKTWGDQMERFMPKSSSDRKINYRAKAELQIAMIQEKARLLEEKMKQYKAEQESADSSGPRVTDEMAYAQMAAQPKLAWILGGDVADDKRITRPKSTASTTDDLPGRPSTSAAIREPSDAKLPRRSKSSGALDEKSRQATIEKRSAGIFERKPSRRPRFYCTFCQKRFHSRIEWMRHEQTIHMPEELWICCPRTGEFPENCPFCAKANPSPSHLADHNYLSCQDKPLSERTFSRKDHFLQHISQEHKVSPREKPVRMSELLEAWKHPLPLKEGHQALHCGFCGLTFPSYKERTEHVSIHFLEGLDMISWWSGRVSHEVKGRANMELLLNPNLPHKCAYCERTYNSLAEAQREHPVCTMWSCSFLPGMQYTIYPAGSRQSVEAVCCYCNDVLVKGDGRVKGAVLREHINRHNFRNCNQRLYFSSQRFRQHLQDSHKTNYDGTLFAGWTLLLKSSKKDRHAIFEPIDASGSPRRAFTDPGSSGTKPQKKQKQRDVPPSMPKLNFMDLTENGSTVPQRKLQRKASTRSLHETRTREHTHGHFFSRAATIDLVYRDPKANPAQAAADEDGSPKNLLALHKPGYPTTSLPVDALRTCPKFYRRTLDTSTRNRLYMRNQEDALSKNSQRLFKKVPSSAFGGLVLHSSLIGAIPARMTNSVDVYLLH